MKPCEYCGTLVSSETLVAGLCEECDEWEAELSELKLKQEAIDRAAAEAEYYGALERRTE